EGRRRPIPRTKAAVALSGLNLDFRLPSWGSRPRLHAWTPSESLAFPGPFRKNLWAVAPESVALWGIISPHHGTQSGPKERRRPLWQARSPTFSTTWFSAPRT